MDLIALAPYDDEGALRVVVEAPKGSTVKIAYEPDLQTFSVSRGLPLGIAYPYDWGFIPGTRAADGDPVDALVLHAASTYPGIVLPCRTLGMVEVRQDGEDGKRQSNNRVIALPIWNDRLGDLEKAKDLPKRIRAELEQFFLSVTFFTAKNACIRGWIGKTQTEAFIRDSTIRRVKKRRQVTGAVSGQPRRSRG
jgi:inorganic pyrophosphatase